MSQISFRNIYKFFFFTKLKKRNQKYELGNLNVTFQCALLYYYNIFITESKFVMNQVQNLL